MVVLGIRPEAIKLILPLSRLCKNSDILVAIWGSTGRYLLTRHLRLPPNMMLSKCYFEAEMKSDLTITSGTRVPVERVAALDTLRGVALLMVICGHFLPEKLAYGFAGAAVSTMGRGGVILFFLLSGYLIFMNLQNQKILPFLSRRLFKIFPAYCSNVLIIAALGQLLEGYPKFSFPVYLANFFLVSDVFRTESISGVYWTLLIEVKFYVVIAIYFFFLKNRYSVAAILILIVTNGLFWLFRGHASQLFTFFPVFFVGMQIFFAEKSGWNKPALIRLAGVTVAVGLNIWFFDDYYNSWSLTYVLAGTVTLILLIRKSIHNAILGFFGRISYSHYLYHTSVGYVLFAMIGRRETIAENLVAVMAVFFATTVIAYISYRIVEVPFVRFGRILESRWVPRGS